MSKGLNIIKKCIKDKQEPVADIRELDLSGQKLGLFTPEMKAALQQCKQLQSLILCECDLTSLKNFPSLSNLQELDLSTNSLPDSEIKQLGLYKALIILSIADNKIQKLETIKELKNALPNLIRLECADNKIESLPNYFKSVFSLFPKLECLDSKDKDGKEVETADFEEDEEQLDDEDEQGQLGQQGQQGQQGEEQEKKPKKKENKAAEESESDDDDAQIDDDYSQQQDEDENE